ncbi:MAG: glycoside hydrolase family 2 [Candidatus Omnitrophica bacterium]|nr:glycoside hydrolase family 2 [Candidatus Omnitrophota bacterium]
MNRVTLFFSASLIALSATLLAAPDWQPAHGPLVTRWAKDVSPDNAHPEYPRPQMVRKDWLNLDGLWDYAIVGKSIEAVPEFQGKILVPFPVESALSGVMKPVNENSRLWYRRTFDVPQEWSGRRVLIHFGAVDWETTVFVNGKNLGTHRGGYDAFSFDITDALKTGEPQELVVSVFDPTDSGQQPRGKQVHEPGGIMYTSTTGIWQTTWLEPVPETSIASLKIVPDVDASCLRLTVSVDGAADDCAVRAIALSSGSKVVQATGKPGREIVLPIHEPILWWPDQPYLYDLNVELEKDGRAVDSVKSYFGMRKIELGRDAQGITRPLLNGRFVFQVGTLDQGFWPDGIYTAPTDAALRYDVEMLKKLGFNMTRKHVKVEPDRWYYWCDKLGLLVWQDMPSGGNGTPEAKQQFELELRRMIQGRYNHPCIILWVVFNEGWGQYDTERLTRWVKQLDPTRLADDASGWTDEKVGDVIDIHSYPGPDSPKPEPDRAAVLGEFGGLGLGVDGHTWAQTTWGYRGMSDMQMLTQQYTRLLRHAWALKKTPGLSAVVYTQTTDVETECNGLLTYDRAVLKVDLDKASEANRGQLPPPGPVTFLSPTARKEPVQWNYTFNAPSGDWFKPGFDASGWKQGQAGFGSQGTPGAVVRTPWTSADIWLRREFQVPEGSLADAYMFLEMHHDEDAEVYLNGVPAVKASGFTTGYKEFEISPEAKAALKPGKNFVAVHCHQTGGGQYIDLGVAESQ